jgi:FkbM family methyltransferase
MQMAAAVGPQGHVYAFEPFDTNADLLERSIEENRFGDRIVFRRAAVGAAPGTATLTFPVETLNSGGAYLLPTGGAPLAGNQKKEVPLVALDALELPHPVRAIKMDVEGAEPQVLQGAARLLARDKPVILSELHPVQLKRASNVTAAQFLAQISALGYRAHRLENGRVGAPLASASEEALVSIVLTPTG